MIFKVEMIIKIKQDSIYITRIYIFSDNAKQLTSADVSLISTTNKKKILIIKK